MKKRKVGAVVLAMLILLVTGCIAQNESRNNSETKLVSKAYSSTFKTMYFRGTPNGWGTSAMILTNDYEWSITNVKFGNTSTERFKFDAFGDWKENYGLNGVKGGADIPVTAGKTYDITFNDSTKKYTVKESIITKCKLVVSLNDITSNSSIGVNGAVMKLRGQSSLDITITSSSVIAVEGLAAGDYTLSIDSVLKSGVDDYAVTGNKTFTIVAGVTKFDVVMDIAKVKTVKGTADLFINVTGNSNSSFVELLYSDFSIMKVYKEGVIVQVEKNITSHNSIFLSNLVIGNYKVVIDYNSNGKKYTGDISFALSKEDMITSGTLNIVYTEIKEYKKTYGTMNFRGTPNNWGTTPMTLVGDYLWEIKEVKTGSSATERFKVDVSNDWVTNFGLDGIKGGKDIPLDANSLYNITFNDNAKVFSVIKITTPTLTIDSYNGITKVGNTEFLLPAKGIYTSNGKASTVELSWTPALDVNKMGDTTYSATVNGLTVKYVLTIADKYPSTYPDMYFRGTPNKFGTTKMVLVNDCSWQTEQTFDGSATERFKFDTKGDWSLNFGDNEGDKIADANSLKDIYINGAAGTYIIKFNDKTKVYSFTLKPTIVGTPVLSLKEGQYYDAQIVTLSSITTGAEIRYTTDGIEPTKNSTLYSGEIKITSTTTIKAKAFKAGQTDSLTASAKYNINYAKLLSKIKGQTITVLGNTTTYYGFIFKLYGVGNSMNLYKGNDISGSKVDSLTEIDGIIDYANVSISANSGTTQVTAQSLDSNGLEIGDRLIIDLPLQ